MASEHSEASGHSVILEFSEGLEYSEVSDISEASGLEELSGRAEALEYESYRGFRSRRGVSEPLVALIGMDLVSRALQNEWKGRKPPKSPSIPKVQSIPKVSRFRWFRGIRGVGWLSGFFSFCCLWGCGRRVGRETSAGGGLLHLNPQSAEAWMVFTPLLEGMLPEIVFIVQEELFKGGFSYVCELDFGLA